LTIAFIVSILMRTAAQLHTTLIIAESPNTQKGIQSKNFGRATRTPAVVIITKEVIHEAV